MSFEGIPAAPPTGCGAAAALLLVWAGAAASGRWRARRSSEPRSSTSADVERALTCPEGDPSGWYRIVDSRELEKGPLKYVRCLGQHLAVFRGTQSGRVFALDAHATHLGDNLGVGGRIQGAYIRCPFHGQWQADIGIGENKIYRRRPVLERGDGPILRMRRWYEQFYREHPKAARTHLP